MLMMIIAIIITLYWSFGEILFFASTIFTFLHDAQTCVGKRKLGSRVIYLHRRPRTWGLRVFAQGPTEMTVLQRLGSTWQLSNHRHRIFYTLVWKVVFGCASWIDALPTLPTLSETMGNSRPPKLKAVLLFLIPLRLCFAVKWLNRLTLHTSDWKITGSSPSFSRTVTSLWPLEQDFS